MATEVIVSYLASLSGVVSYGVQIEFTDIFEPSLISGDGLPFVSVEDEIDANAKPGATGSHCNRIPYGSPLYIWERVTKGKSEVLYVGQTMSMTIQKRFEGHAAAVKILADHVNQSTSSIYFRLCSVLDLKCVFSDGSNKTNAIEHFSFVDAKSIIDDIEAFLIYRIKPPYNTKYKNNEREYRTAFKIDAVKNIASTSLFL